MTGPLALVGSGEYLPVMQPVEALLLDGRPPRYVQLATAAAPEGEASLDRWHELGREQAERLRRRAGRRRRPRPQPTPTTPLWPGSSTARGSSTCPAATPSTSPRPCAGRAVWAAIEAAWRGGAALAGCSAGAMALSGWVPAMRDLGRHPDPGLGLLPHLRVIPHFDRMLGWVPDILTRALLQATGRRDRARHRRGHGARRRPRGVGRARPPVRVGPRGRPPPGVRPWCPPRHPVAAARLSAGSPRRTVAAVCLVGAGGRG